MKTILKKLSFGILTLGFFTMAQTATAHEQSGILGKPANATDYYQVNCFDDGAGQPGYLISQISYSAPAAKPLISLLVVHGLQADNITDNGTPKAGHRSPSLKTQAGSDPTYYLLVTKTMTGAIGYTIDYHCMTNNNDHTGTEITPLQNK